MTAALLDTSVVIAQDEQLGDVRQQGAAISVITLGELRAGVLLAGTGAARASRQKRLAAVRERYQPLAVDESVAESYGDVLAVARAERRTAKATDLLIIATAAASGRSLITFDARQGQLAAAAGVESGPPA